MKVKILTHTPNPEQVIACAAKLCYSNSDIESLFEKQTSEKVDAFLNKLISIGHESPLEHVSFTFAIEGISRATLAQLSRHRLANFSVQSQRYVNLADTFEYVTPLVITNMNANKEFNEDMDTIHNMYLKWQRKIHDHILETDYPTNGMPVEKVANENARAVLPNACTTKMVLTMNARELISVVFKKRCCKRAQDEIVLLANEMLRQCREIAPILFKTSGAPCVIGKCPEGSMTCGTPYDKIK